MYIRVMMHSNLKYCLPLLFVLHCVLNKDIFTPLCFDFDFTHENAIFFFQKANN